MGASKNGNDIWIEGAGNTESTILADIGDATWWAEPTADNFELRNGHGLDVRAGGELTFGNIGDFSDARTLTVTASGGTWYNRHGGSINVYGDFTLNGNFNLTTLFSGKMLVLGNATYKPFFDETQLTFTWNSLSEADYAHDTWAFDYFEISVSAAPGSLIGIEIASCFTMPAHIFNHFTITGDTHGFRILGESDAGANESITISNGSMLSGNSIARVQSVFSSPYWHKCSFAGAISQSIYVTSICPQYIPKNHLALDEYDPLLGQHYAFFDDCAAIGGTAEGLRVVAGKVLLRDYACGSTGNNILVFPISGVYLWTGNTFTGAFARAGNGTIFYVFGLDLTLLDPNSNPLEDVCVTIEQKDGKEIYQFITGSDGKVITQSVFDGNIIAVHKEWISGDPVSGVFDMWSDSSNNTYHRVTISHPLYLTEQIDYIMDQDRAPTITMQVAPVTPPTVSGKIIRGTSSWL